MSSWWEPRFPPIPKNIIHFFPLQYNVNPQKHFHKPHSPYHIMAKYSHDYTTTNQLIRMGTETKGEAGAKAYKIHRMLTHFIILISANHHAVRDSFRSDAGPGRCGGPQTTIEPLKNGGIKYRCMSPPPVTSFDRILRQGRKESTRPPNSPERMALCAV